MNFYTTILVSFLTGGFVDEVVDNWADYQWYEYDVYVCFLYYHTLTVKHDIMVKEFGGLSEKLF